MDVEKLLAPSRFRILFYHLGARRTHVEVGIEVGDVATREVDVACRIA